MHTYIVTVTAADRVGIVFSVAGTLRDQGGNILELSQTVMRGYFTIILAVEFPAPQDPKQLADAITERGKRFDLTVAVIEAKSERVEPPVPNGERFILTVLGDDPPGNIHGIAGCLAAHGVNIVDLHARVDGARFSLVMEAFIPPDLSPGDGPGRARAVRPRPRTRSVRAAREHLPGHERAQPGPRRAGPESRKETPLHRTEDVLATLGMIRQHKLDVRTVTMGIDLQPCASPDLATLCRRIRERLLRFAGRLRAVCREVEGRYGIPIVNRRIAVSPIALGRRRALGRGLSRRRAGRSTPSRPRSGSTSSAASPRWCRRAGRRATGG